MRNWETFYSVNHSMMDTDHKNILGMLRVLHAEMKTNQNKPIVNTLVSELHHYTACHILREERHLKEYRYIDFEPHQQQHFFFLKKIIECKNNYLSDNIITAIQMLPLLNDWLVNHITKVDMRYKAE